jgi:hypothetical protein
MRGRRSRLVTPVKESVFARSFNDTDTDFSDTFENVKEVPGLSEE